MPFLVEVGCVFVDVGLGVGDVGRSGATRLYRVSQGDEVDASSAQFLVNSSCSCIPFSKEG